MYITTYDTAIINYCQMRLLGYAVRLFLIFRIQKKDTIVKNPSPNTR